MAPAGTPAVNPFEYPLIHIVLKQTGFMTTDLETGAGGLFEPTAFISFPPLVKPGGAQANEMVRGNGITDAFSTINTPEVREVLVSIRLLHSGS